MIRWLFVVGGGGCECEPIVYYVGFGVQVVGYVFYRTHFFGVVLGMDDVHHEAVVWCDDQLGLVGVFDYFCGGDVRECDRC